MATTDLHTHTTASDGLLSPASLVALARERGLSVLGVTDHDTVAGLDAAVGAAGSDPIVVPGVELSTSIAGHDVHILGYFVNTADARFTATLHARADARRRRVVRMVEQLQAIGYPLELDAIVAQSDEGTIGRPHVARALVGIGAADSVSDAFDRLLTPGRPGWAPYERFTPEEAVGLLVENGAVPVLAHPYTTGHVDATLRRLVPAGLRGLEVHYGEYDAAQRADLAAVAAGWRLLPTGGSDYHGPNFREGRELGSVTVPDDVYPALKALHQSLQSR